MMQEFREYPPDSETVTPYDRQCFKLYIMLLEADAFGAVWDEAYEWAFGRDIGQIPEIARCQYFAHLKRAKWMTERGYRQLL